MIRGSYDCLLFFSFFYILYVSDNFFTSGEFYMSEIQFFTKGEKL